MHHLIAFRLPTASLRRCDLRRTSPRGVEVATLELGRVRSPPSNSSLLFSPRVPKSALQQFAVVHPATRRSPPPNLSPRFQHRHRHGLPPPFDTGALSFATSSPSFEELRQAAADA